ncbi:MAG: crosslink repair DNA glycosylase YcaQ family protein [Anaerolineaceae bacterium]|nr:crosslink repair DNA glycosylase YcaQ family protein [Anaerolineaceae bacterium]
MTPPKISLSTARNLLLEAQGMLHPSGRPAVKDDVLLAIRRMGALQIDTISVVARSPYLVLWSRLGDYQPAWLDELLAEGAIFEYWSHAACFLPAQDFPYYRRMMLDGLRRWGNSSAWLEEHSQVVDMIIERINREGALLSSSFDNSNRQPGGWWNWKEEKRALEHLFNDGTLLIARRQKFQRVYDLWQRVRPGWDDVNTPTLPEVLSALTLRTVKVLGIVRSNWVPDYFRLPKKGTAGLLEDLAANGQLCKVDVEDWNSPAYVLPETFRRIENGEAGALQPDLTTLLSPFDPLVWDRTRAKALFHFDYSIECYLPAAKRRYGYFSLPILSNGELIGRLDAKAHRKLGLFEIKSIYLEAGTRLTPELVDKLRAAISGCANWHKTPQVSIIRSEPAELAGLLAE